MNAPSGEKSAFVLSRIYSQGWNAAKKMLAAGAKDITAPQAAAANPYRTGEERLRWTRGFMEALASPVKPNTGPAAHMRRAQAARRIPTPGSPGDE